MKIRNSLIFVLFCAFILSSNFAQAQDKRNWRDILHGSSSSSSTSTTDKKNKPKEDEKLFDTNPQGLLDLVDTPTTNILDYGAYRLNFRFYAQGGITSALHFGVFRRLNIGVSWDNEKVLGSQDPETNTPALSVKVRAFDGSARLPSFTIGYDGQGRFFNRAKDEYQERERGLFFVFGRELFLSGLEAHAGTNIAEFKQGRVFGFLGLSYNIENRLVLFTEYDNIRVGPDNRWNVGVRLFPVDWLSVDFAVRQVASNKEKDRFVRINYVGKF